MKDFRDELGDGVNSMLAGLPEDKKPIVIIVAVVVIIALVLWSIQHLTCNVFGGMCLKILCFGRFGLC